MSVFIAASHIVGAVVIYLVLATLGFFLRAWASQRSERRALENAAIELGVPVDVMQSEEMAPGIIKLSSSRYSTELLRNRLSDFCGVLLRAWTWLELVTEIVILIAVLWQTFTNLADAALAWLIIPAALFFSLVSVIGSMVCKLLTGRYPGEAKQARKSLKAFIDGRHAANLGLETALQSTA